MKRKFKTTVTAFNGVDTEPIVIEEYVAAIDKIDANKQILSKFSTNSVLKIKSVLFIILLFLSIIINAQTTVTTSCKGIKFIYTDGYITQVNIDKNYFIAEKYNPKQALKIIKRFVNFKNDYYEGAFNIFMDQTYHELMDMENIKSLPEKEFRVKYLIVGSNYFLNKINYQLNILY